MVAGTWSAPDRGLPAAGGPLASHSGGTAPCPRGRRAGPHAGPGVQGPRLRRLVGPGDGSRDVERTRSRPPCSGRWRVTSNWKSTAHHPRAAIKVVSLRCDNGPELTCGAMADWARRSGRAAFHPARRALAQRLLVGCVGDHWVRCGGGAVAFAASALRYPQPFSSRQRRWIFL